MRLIDEDLDLDSVEDYEAESTKKRNLKLLENTLVIIAFIGFTILGIWGFIMHNKTKKEGEAFTGVVISYEEVQNPDGLARHIVVEVKTPDSIKGETFEDSVTSVYREGDIIEGKYLEYKEGDYYFVINK